MAFDSVSINQGGVAVWVFGIGFYGVTQQISATRPSHFVKRSFKLSLGSGFLENLTEANCLKKEKKLSLSQSFLKKNV